MKAALKFLVLLVTVTVFSYAQVEETTTRRLAPPDMGDDRRRPPTDAPAVSTSINVTDSSPSTTENSLNTTVITETMVQSTNATDDVVDGISIHGEFTPTTTHTTTNNKGSVVSPMSTVVGIALTTLLMAMLTI